MPNDILDTQLTLDPNNQIARLGETGNLIDGTEYDITAGTFLRPGTRFTFKGRTDIALTKRPQGVPARGTQADAHISPAPELADAVSLLTIATYPYHTKDRLAASGLNSSFLPIAGGTVTGSVTINNALTVGRDVTITNGYLYLMIQTTWGYILRPNVAGYKNLALAVDGGGLLDNCLINAGTTTVAGNLIGQGQYYTQGINSGYSFSDRHNSSQSWVWYADLGSARLWFNGAGDRIWVDTAGSLTTTGNITGGNTVATGGDFYLSRTTTGYGYLIRPNVAGYKNLGFSCVGGGQLDNVSIWSTNTNIQGTLWINGGNLNCTGNMSVTTLYASAELYCVNLWANSGQVYGASVRSGGTLQVDGSSWVNGNSTVGGNINTNTLWSAGNISTGGSLTANGPIQTNSNRIVCIGGNSPSVTCWNTSDGAAWGIWASSHQMGFGASNGDGSPAQWVMALDTTKVFIYNGFVVNNLLTAYQSAPVTIFTQLVPSGDAVWDCGVGGQAWLYVSSYNFQNVSDPAVKRDVQPVAAGCLGLVQAVEPKTYKFTTAQETENERVHWGFMAPEIADVMERAGHRFDAVRTENGVVTLAYNELIAVLWQAVRELAEKLTMEVKSDA